MQEIRTLKLLFDNNVLMKIKFTDYQPDFQESEKILDEIEMAYKEKRPVYLGEMRKLEAFAQGRKVPMFEHISSKKLIAWDIY